MYKSLFDFASENHWLLAESLTTVHNIHKTSQATPQQMHFNCFESLHFIYLESLILLSSSEVKSWWVYIILANTTGKVIALKCS